MKKVVFLVTVSLLFAGWSFRLMSSGPELILDFQADSTSLIIPEGNSSSFTVFIQNNGVHQLQANLHFDYSSTNITRGSGVSGSLGNYFTYTYPIDAISPGVCVITITLTGSAWINNVHYTIAKKEIQVTVTVPSPD